MWKMIRQKISRILNILSLIVLVPVSVLTMGMVISFSKIINPTEGTGVVLVPIYLLNKYNLIIALVFNIVAYWLLPEVNINYVEKKKNYVPFIIVMLTFLVISIEVFILFFL